jgi:hypothetical protein
LYPTLFAAWDGTEWRRQTALFFAGMLAISMIFSPFLLSISIWGMVFVAWWESAAQAVVLGKALKIKSLTAWKAGFFDGCRRYGQHPALWALSFLLLTPAITWFWSIDTHYWWERTRVRIPFLVLPWAFANLPQLSERQLSTILYVLVWVMVLFCIGVGINYSLNYEDIQIGLEQGHSIPVPRHHIRFNLILVTTILSGGWLWMRRFVWHSAWEREALGWATIRFFAHTHRAQRHGSPLHCAGVYRSAFCVAHAALEGRVGRSGGVGGSTNPRI